MEKQKPQIRSGKKKSQENETPKPDLNIPAISPAKKKTAELEKWSKRAVAVIFMLLLSALGFWPELFTEILGGKAFTTSVDIVTLLRVEVILIVLVIGSRLEKIKDAVYQSLIWKRDVGLLRYGVACLSIAFLIFAWAAGGFAATIFSASSTTSTTQQIYNYVQVFLFFGLSIIGGSLLVVVNLIEANYNFDSENPDFLNPYLYIDKKVTEIFSQLQNSTNLNLSDFSNLYVISWNVKPDEKIIELQLGKQIIKEKNESTSSNQLFKWVIYKVNVDFKGRLLSIQRSEADDYQKIRHA